MKIFGGYLSKCIKLVFLGYIVDNKMGCIWVCVCEKEKKKVNNTDRAPNSEQQKVWLHSVGFVFGELTKNGFWRKDIW